jgi:flagellar biosynthesis protein FlhG
MGGTRLLVVTVPEATALTDAYALIKLVDAQLPTLPIDILVNRIAEAADVIETFERLAQAVDRSMGRRLRSVGGLAEMPGLRDAMHRAGGLRDSPAATLLRRAMEEVVAHYLPLDAPDPRARHSGW